MNLLFDYDGTLHDCARIYCPAFRSVDAGLTALGMVPAKARTDEEITRWLGYGAREMWQQYAPQLSEAEREKGSAAIGASMLKSVREGRAALYPHTEETLDAMKKAGHTLLFLSNCKTAYLEAHREHFHLDRWFSGFFCTEQFGWQPKTAVFPAIRERFPGEYVVIGDRFHDMAIAEAYVLKAVGCLYGYGSVEELRVATVLISGIEELVGAVERLSQA